MKSGKNDLVDAIADANRAVTSVNDERAKRLTKMESLLAEAALLAREDSDGTAALVTLAMDLARGDGHPCCAYTGAGYLLGAAVAITDLAKLPVAAVSISFTNALRVQQARNERAEKAKGQA